MLPHNLGSWVAIAAINTPTCTKLVLGADFMSGEDITKQGGRFGGPGSPVLSGSLARHFKVPASGLQMSSLPLCPIDLAFQNTYVLPRL